MSMQGRTRPGAAAVARIATLVTACLGLGACALSADRAAPPAVEAPDVVRYAVERGDRLSLIAREFTGDQELWRTLADLNGIDDPRKLAVGQVLEIPVSLIPEADREARLAASVAVDAADDGALAGTTTTRPTARDPVRAPGVPAADGPTRADPAPAVVPARSVPAVGVSRAVRTRAEPVVVSAVRRREAFDLSPLDEEGGEASIGSRFVEVLGSYTPQGIYTRPAAQSRVLMRVTPGTVLPLERSVDGWYRVATSAGPGFLRDEDARLVEPDRPGTADAGPGDAASR